MDVMDAVGSNIVVNTRCGEVMRILPRMNEVGQASVHLLWNHVSHSAWKMNFMIILWSDLSELTNELCITLVCQKLI